MAKFGGLAPQISGSHLGRSRVPTVASVLMTFAFSRKDISSCVLKQRIPQVNEHSQTQDAMFGNEMKRHCVRIHPPPLS